MPQNLARAARLGWRTADVMWRAAGDTATDYNHYTKRTMLGRSMPRRWRCSSTTTARRHADTRAFLARRIDGIMQFEKAKAGVIARTANRPSLSRFIGRLRYPVA